MIIRFWILIFLTLSGCRKISPEDVIGTYVPDDENGKHLLTRFENCTLEIRADSSFLLAHCNDSSRSAQYKWWISKGSDIITVDEGKYITFWETEGGLGKLKAFKRFDEGRLGKLSFKRKD